MSFSLFSHWEPLIFGVSMFPSKNIFSRTENSIQFISIKITWILLMSKEVKR